MRKLTYLSLCWLFVLSFSLTVQAQPNYAGRWSTTWGNGGASADMYLNQKDNRVWGNYSYRGGSVSGVLYGDVLRGSWAQSDGARGTFEFFLSRDGESFKGKWRNGNSGSWSRDPWNGVRY